MHSDTTPSGMVELTDVTRVFGRGDGAVNALDGVTLSLGRGHVHRDHGPLGVRQVDAAAERRGPRPARPAAASGSASTSSASWASERWRGLRRERIGFVFQSFNLLGALTAEQNVALPSRLAGRGCRAPPCATRSSASGSASALATARRSSPAASSSAWRSPARWSASRTSIFADEPTGALDTRSGRAVLALLRRTIDEGGRTLVMVTHDPSAAAWADRVVFMADGRLAGELHAPDGRAGRRAPDRAGGLTCCGSRSRPCAPAARSLAGAFVAIWLAVTLAYAHRPARWRARSARPAPAACGRRRGRPRRSVRHRRAGDDPEQVDVIPGPRLPAAAVARVAAVAGVAGAVGDVVVPGRRLRRCRRADGRRAACTGHGWASAALTPYRLTAGHAPVRAARRRRRLAPGRPARRQRCTSPRRAARRTYRVAGIARGSADHDRGQAALFFPARDRGRAVRAPRPRSTRSASSPKPGARLAGLRRARPRRARPRPRGRRRRRRPAGDATASRSSRSSARWAASPASWRCSWSPARSRSRSPSGGGRPRCCAPSGRRRARSAA